MSIKFKKVYEGSRPLSNFSFDKLKKVIEKISLDIVLEAKAIHRFTPRSNDLERSVRNRINYGGTSKSKKIVSTFLLDNRIANYGKFIHNGFKSWKPDPFLEKAVDNGVKNLKRLLEESIK